MNFELLRDERVWTGGKKKTLVCNDVDISFFFSLSFYRINCFYHLSNGQNINFQCLISERECRDYTRIQSVYFMRTFLVVPTYTHAASPLPYANTSKRLLLTRVRLFTNIEELRVTKADQC